MILDKMGDFNGFVSFLGEVLTGMIDFLDSIVIFDFLTFLDLIKISIILYFFIKIFFRIKSVDFHFKRDSGGGNK